jgi:hypothetical protein
MWRAMFLSPRLSQPKKRGRGGSVRGFSTSRGSGLRDTPGRVDLARVGFFRGVTAGALVPWNAGTPILRR